MITTGKVLFEYLDDENLLSHCISGDWETAPANVQRIFSEASRVNDALRSYFRHSEALMQARDGQDIGPLGKAYESARIAAYTALGEDVPLPGDLQS